MSETRPVFVRRFDAFDRDAARVPDAEFPRPGRDGPAVALQRSALGAGADAPARQFRGRRLDASRVRAAAHHRLRGPSLAASAGACCGATTRCCGAPIRWCRSRATSATSSAHIRWFVGGGPRPRFDRFTYWEKFDYWAVFWGMGIIGASGLLLWFPEFFATRRARLGLQRRDARARRRSAACRRLHLHDALLQRPPAAREVSDGHRHLHRPGDARRNARRTARRTARASNARAASTRCAPTRRRTGCSRLGRTIGTIAITAGLILVGLIVYAMLS